MKLSEIERIAKAAMDACSGGHQPSQRQLRPTADCSNSLAEVVDPAFFETDQSRRGSLTHLLQQANVWGAIVRQRIYSFGAADLVTLLPLPLGIPPETFSTSSTRSSSSWEVCRWSGGPALSAT